MNKLIIYYIIINILTFILMGYDKKNAIKKKERIPEMTLFTLSFMGGGRGTLLGMLVFHHKTKKLKFLILIPISIIIHIFLQI